MEKEVNFLIIGSGPIGLTLTTLISESRVKDIRQKVILKGRSNCAELREKGISLEFGSKIITNRPVVIDNLNLNVSVPRIVVIATKTYDLPGVLKELADNHIKVLAFFLPINGIDSHDEDLEKLIANNKKFSGIPIISGSITLPVEKNAPNAAKVTNAKGGIALAKYNDVEGAEETLRLLEVIFTNSGVEVIKCDNHLDMRWSKMLLNMLGNGIGAILNRSANQIFSNPMTAGIERGCIREFFQVIDHKNIKLVDLPGYKAKKLNSLRLLCAWWMPLQVFQWKMLGSVAKARGDKLPSLHYDLEVLKRTATEILNYNGGIVYAAQKLGIKTPYNSTVVAVLQSISSNYRNNPYREETGVGLLWSKIQKALGK